MKKRILCVCNGGNCRSVALAEVLKGTFGCEAVAIGTYWFSPSSQALLGEWADVIAFVEPRDAKLPEPDLTKWKASVLWGGAYNTKRTVLPIGPDIWGHNDWDAIKAAVTPFAKTISK